MGNDVGKCKKYACATNRNSCDATHYRNNRHLYNRDALWCIDRNMGSKLSCGSADEARCYAECHDLKYRWYMGESGKKGCIYEYDPTLVDLWMGPRDAFRNIAKVGIDIAKDGIGFFDKAGQGKWGDAWDHAYKGLDKLWMGTLSAGVDLGKALVKGDWEAAKDAFLDGINMERADDIAEALFIDGNFGKALTEAAAQITQEGASAQALDVYNYIVTDFTTSIDNTLGIPLMRELTNMADPMKLGKNLRALAQAKNNCDVCRTGMKTVLDPVMVNVEKAALNKANCIKLGTSVTARLALNPTLAPLMPLGPTIGTACTVAAVAYKVQAKVRGGVLGQKSDKSKLVDLIVNEVCGKNFCPDAKRATYSECCNASFPNCCDSYLSKDGKKCGNNQSVGGTDCRTRYSGYQNKTRSGKTCTNWTTPQNGATTYDFEHHPSLNLGPHNFCRNPDGSTGGIWCYTGTNGAREYCDPVPMNRTISGRKCQSWKKDTPHKHNFNSLSPKAFLYKRDQACQGKCKGKGSNTSFAGKKCTAMPKDECKLASSACQWFETPKSSTSQTSKAACDTFCKDYSYFNLKSGKCECYEDCPTAKQASTTIYKRNMCMNPDGMDTGLWCYTEDEGKRWERCSERSTVQYGALSATVKHKMEERRICCNKDYPNCCDQYMVKDGLRSDGTQKYMCSSTHTHGHDCRALTSLAKQSGIDKHDRACLAWTNPAAIREKLTPWHHPDKFGYDNFARGTDFEKPWSAMRCFGQPSPTMYRDAKYALTNGISLAGEPVYACPDGTIRIDHSNKTACTKGAVPYTLAAGKVFNRWLTHEEGWSYAGETHDNSLPFGCVVTSVQNNEEKMNKYDGKPMTHFDNWRHEITRRWTVPTVKFNTAINDVKCKTTGSGKLDTVGQCVCASPNVMTGYHRNRHEVKPVKAVAGVGTVSYPESCSELGRVQISSVEECQKAHALLTENVGTQNNMWFGKVKHDALPSGCIKMSLTPDGEICDTSKTTCQVGFGFNAAKSPERCNYNMHGMHPDKQDPQCICMEMNYALPLVEKRYSVVPRAFTGNPNVEEGTESQGTRWWYGQPARRGNITVAPKGVWLQTGHPEDWMLTPEGKIRTRVKGDTWSKGTLLSHDGPDPDCMFYDNDRREFVVLHSRHKQGSKWVFKQNGRVGSSTPWKQRGTRERCPSGSNNVYTSNNSCKQRAKFQQLPFNLTHSRDVGHDDEVTKRQHIPGAGRGTYRVWSTETSRDKKGYVGPVKWSRCYYDVARGEMINNRMIFKKGYECSGNGVKSSGSSPGLTLAGCDKLCRDHHYFDWRAGSENTNGQARCECHDTCTPKKYAAYNIYSKDAFCSKDNLCLTSSPPVETKDPSAPNHLLVPARALDRHGWEAIPTHNGQTCEPNYTEMLSKEKCQDMATRMNMTFNARSGGNGCTYDSNTDTVTWGPISDRTEEHKMPVCEYAWGLEGERCSYEKARETYGSHGGMGMGAQVPPSTKEECKAAYDQLKRAQGSPYKRELNFEEIDTATRIQGCTLDISRATITWNPDKGSEKGSSATRFICSGTPQKDTTRLNSGWDDTIANCPSTRSARDSESGNCRGVDPDVETNGGKKRLVGERLIAVYKAGQTHADISAQTGCVSLRFKDSCLALSQAKQEMDSLYKPYGSVEKNGIKFNETGPTWAYGAPKPSPKLQIVGSCKGAQLTDNDTCFESINTNWGRRYFNRQLCTVEVKGAPTTLNTVGTFNIEGNSRCSWDWLAICEGSCPSINSMRYKPRNPNSSTGIRKYCKYPRNNNNAGPNNVTVNPGDQIQFRTDYSVYRSGFKVCLDSAQEEDKTYYMGDKGEVCDSEFDVIRSREECQQALTSLGKPDRISWSGNYSTHIPAGCSIREPNHGHFEKSAHGLGKGRGDLAPVCKRAGTAENADEEDQSAWTQVYDGIMPAPFPVGKLKLRGQTTDKGVLMAIGLYQGKRTWSRRLTYDDTNPSTNGFERVYYDSTVEEECTPEPFEKGADLRRVIGTERCGGVDEEGLTDHIEIWHFSQNGSISDVKFEIEKRPSPIDCKVGEWEQWSECSKECMRNGIAGKRTRTRPVTQQTQHGGYICPNLTETQVCGNNPCPIVHAWAASGRCRNPEYIGVEKSLQDCAEKASDQMGGDPIYATGGHTDENVACYRCTKPSHVGYSFLANSYPKNYYQPESYHVYRMFDGKGGDNPGTQEETVDKCAQACSSFTSPQGHKAKGFFVRSNGDEWHGRCYCTKTIDGAWNSGSSYKTYKFEREKLSDKCILLDKPKLSDDPAVDGGLGGNCAANLTKDECDAHAKKRGYKNQSKASHYIASRNRHDFQPSCSFKAPWGVFYNEASGRCVSRNGFLRSNVWGNNCNYWVNNNPKLCDAGNYQANCNKKCIEYKCGKKSKTSCPNDYYMKSKGSVCDSTSAVITSYQECQTALASLGKSNSISWTGNYSTRIPRGCSHKPHTGKGHFETSTTGVGKGRSDLAPVCKTLHCVWDDNAVKPSYSNPHTPICASTVKKNTALPKISHLPKNYDVEFDITPRGKVSGWSNVMHLSHDNNNSGAYGRRIPGIWFMPNSLRLHVRDGDSSDGNAGCDPAKHLTKNQKTNVRVEIRERSTKVFYDDAEVCSRNVAANKRHSFNNVWAYAADPWYKASNASVNNIRVVERDSPDCGGLPTGTYYEVRKGSHPPVDCKYNWSSWSSCSKNCGGVKTQTMSITQEGIFGGKACPPIGERTQTMACNRPGNTCTMGSQGFVKGEWVNGAGTEQWKVEHDKKIYWRRSPGASSEKIQGSADCMRYNTSTNKINVINNGSRLFERTYSTPWRQPHPTYTHSCAR